jgi:hypothetical protein
MIVRFWNCSAPMNNRLVPGLFACETSAKRMNSRSISPVRVRTVFCMLRSCFLTVLIVICSIAFPWSIVVWIALALLQGNDDEPEVVEEWFDQDGSRIEPPPILRLVDAKKSRKRRKTKR